MERPIPKVLRIGEWTVNPASGEISRNGFAARLEERSLRLLLSLAAHPGEIVSIDDLLNRAWPDIAVSPDSVYQAVASLRRQLGDDSKQPAYIATVPRLGYRMVAEVSAEPSAPKVPPEAEAPVARSRAGFPWAFTTAAATVLCLLLAGAFLFNRRTPSTGKPQKSIAVLPFLDLTEDMKQEPFADGMTEELIGKLSKVPGLSVPAPTSSFYYKGKQVPVADIAKALGVAFVLDGSVRKSGARVRVAARLVRADSGYVVWTETYDRPFDDILMVQDDIAGEVTKALRSSIDARPEQNPAK